MKIEIDIPQEFEEHFILDKFEDSLHRLSSDAHLIAGNYEQETAIMLIKAFKESKTAYDVDKIVERLENCSDSTTFRYDKETGVLYEVEADVWARIADGTEVVIPIKSGGTNGH